ncbi:SulP family inorganic anion transporter [Hymenobacter saemangeumensis]|uniref:SulP family inorganic anion transporter n=1 Tax=Hymenobacter saemangeumensis TaxID=1084522 RepID=A0ABP8INH2_9BACT
MFGSVGRDLPAGLVVFLVALPLCLGISLASGAPLLAGMITGIVGGVMVSWLSGSALSVSGPAAGLTTIMLSALATLGSFPAVLTATVVAGVIQVLLGTLKAGIIGMYFPVNVIRGMLAAIGLTLILKQIPHFLGTDADYFEDMDFLQFNGQNTFTAIANAAKHIALGSVIIGVVSLLLLLLWDTKAIKRLSFTKLVPGALIAVIVSILLNELFKSSFPALQIKPQHLVRLPVVSSFGELLAEMSSPDWSFLTKSKTYLVAGTIAIVASLESLLSVEAVDKLDPHKRTTPPNRELMAQGAGNIVAGLLGGLPLTAVIVRSSANINAGGQTRLSAFFHGLLLLTSLLFLASLLNLIPLSALAAVLLVVGYKLTKPALYAMQWRLGWSQFIPFIVTIVAILFTDLLKGVGIGLAIGFFFILKANAEAAFIVDDTETQPGCHYLRLSEHVSFLNKASIVQALERIPHNSRVILDGSKSQVIDHDVLEAIESFRIAAPERGIDVELRGIRHVEVAGH